MICNHHKFSFFATINNAVHLWGKSLSILVCNPIAVHRNIQDYKYKATFTRQISIIWQKYFTWSRILLVGSKLSVNFMHNYILCHHYITGLMKFCSAVLEELRWKKEDWWKNKSKHYTHHRYRTRRIKKSHTVFKMFCHLRVTSAVLGGRGIMVNNETMK